MQVLGYTININAVSFIDIVKTYQKTEHFLTIVIDGVKVCLEASGDITPLESAKKELDAALESALKPTWAYKDNAMNTSIQ